MIKTLTFLAYGFASFYTVEVVDVTIEATKVLTWDGLGIIEKIRIMQGIGLQIAMSVISVLIFKSIWVRKGYAGIDEILEGKEVSLFITHVIAMFSFISFFYFAMWYEYTPVPDSTFYICGAGFVSPEVFYIVNFFMEKYKNKKDAN